MAEPTTPSFEPSADSVASLSASAFVLRPAPAGMPETLLAPPVIAEAGDPFALVRILNLLARIPRGRLLRLDDVTAHLNARHLDWLFRQDVVLAACVALQSNWFADYRNQSGIVLEQGDRGVTITIEDSSRVDPWLVRQAQRAAAECRTALAEFARADA
jgi:hypothetical protein